MKHPDYHNYRRESAAAMAWLVRFAILVVGVVQQRFSAGPSIEVHGGSPENVRANAPSAQAAEQSARGRDTPIPGIQPGVRATPTKRVSTISIADPD